MSNVTNSRVIAGTLVVAMSGAAQAGGYGGGDEIGEQNNYYGDDYELIMNGGSPSAAATAGLEMEGSLNPSAAANNHANVTGRVDSRNTLTGNNSLEVERIGSDSRANVNIAPGAIQPVANGGAAEQEQTNGNNEIQVDDHSINKIDARQGAATNGMAARLETARFLAQACESRFSVEGRLGDVFGNYAGAGISYHPSLKFVIQNTQTGAIFSGQQLWDAAPVDRGHMTYGMGKDTIALAMCFAEALYGTGDRVHRHIVTEEAQRHNWERSKNLPGAKDEEKASVAEHMQAHMYVMGANSVYRDAMGCTMTSYVNEGGTGEINQKDRPTPTQVMMNMFGLKKPTKDQSTGRVAQQRAKLIPECEFKTTIPEPPKNEGAGNGKVSDESGTNNIFDVLSPN